MEALVHQISLQSELTPEKIQRMLDQIPIYDEDLAAKLKIESNRVELEGETSIRNDITSALSQLPEPDVAHDHDSPRQASSDSMVTVARPTYLPTEEELLRLYRSIPDGVDEKGAGEMLGASAAESDDSLRVFPSPSFDNAIEECFGESRKDAKPVKTSALPTSSMAPGVNVPDRRLKKGRKKVTFSLVPGSSPHNPHFRGHPPVGSSGSSNGSNGLAASTELSRFQSRLEDLRKWSLSTYKCTRQLLSEKLGKGSRTIDPELEQQIEILRETQLKYLNVLRLARALWTHFNNVVITQRQLADSFSELGQKSPELQEEFTYNAETQKALVRNGETLLGALNFFISSLNTLCNKTMEDTLTTIKQYENARIEYDAYRNELESVNPSITTQPSASSAPSPSKRDPGLESKIMDTQENFSIHKDRFEKLRSDVAIKLKFLDENKVKVMHKQLLLFHNAISAYFSGNQSALDATLKQFNIKLKVSPDKPSWLEQNQ